MRQPLEWQSQFAAALVDPALPAPPGVVGPNGMPGTKRFAVYRNNVVAGLIAVLRDSFPAARRIVGEEFFEAMARSYVLQEPPRSPVLLEYGSGFAGFVAAFEPVSMLPYLSDVCRIERAWLDAYHTIETRPLTLVDLTAIRPEQIPGMRLLLHPSVRLIRSTFPAFTIWKTNIDGGVPIPVDLVDNGENVLVARPWADVEVRSVSEAGMVLIEALARGWTIFEATEAATSSDPTFDIAAALTGLFGMGLLAGMLLNETTANEN